MTLVSRKEAIDRKLKWYFTGKPCVRGHISKRNINGNCLKCKTLHDKKYCESHAKQVASYQKDWKSKNKESIKIALSAYYEVNKKRICMRVRGYKLANKENIKIKAIEYREKFQYKLNALSAKRYATKKQRTPPWLTKKHLIEILEFYEKAQFLSKETGIAHHVDHIVPLLGKKVSGLHVPWNLQVLTASENTSKGNRVVI